MKNAVLVLALLLAGCGPPAGFESGDKVWVDLPAENPRRDGFAEATVIEIKGKMVLVKVDSVRIHGARDAAQGVVAGQTTFIELDRLSEIEAGRRAYEERMAVYRGLDVLLRAPGTYDEDSASVLRKLATSNQMVDAQLTLEVLSVAAPLARLGAGDGGFPAAPTLEFAALHPALRETLMRYPGAYEAARASDAGGEDAMEGALVARALVEHLHASLEKLVESDAREAAEAIAFIEAEDRAFHSFRSDGGRLPIEGVGLESFLERRSAERRDALAARIGTELLADIDPGQLKSIEEAQQKLDAAVQEASALALKLGRPVVSDQDEAAFLASVAREIEARANQAEAERLAAERRRAAEKEARERAAEERALADQQRAERERAQAAADRRRREELAALESSLEGLCRTYYDTKGEFAGKYTMGEILRTRIERSGDRATAHVEYRWRRLGSGETGIDRRTFALRLSGPLEWTVSRMGGHMSARF